MRRTHRSAFTLIELLVVIAIIAILSAIFMPALRNALEKGRRSVCLSNQHQLAVGLRSYMNDHDGKVPPGAILVGGRGCPGYERSSRRGSGLKSLYADQSLLFNNNSVCRNNEEMDWVSHGFLIGLQYFTEPSTYYCPSGPRPRFDGVGNVLPIVEFAYANLLTGNNTVQPGNRFTWSHYVMRQRIALGDAAVISDEMDLTQRWATTDLFWDGNIAGPWHVDGYNVAFYDGHARWLPDPDQSLFNTWQRSGPGTFLYEAERRENY